MEANQYFSAFVLAMCALDCIWSVCERLASRWRREDRPWRDAMAEKGSRGLQRSDWYAFFHCADLIGKEPVDKHKPPENRNIAEREVQRRPRVGAR